MKKTEGRKSRDTVPLSKTRVLTVPVLFKILLGPPVSSILAAISLPQVSSSFGILFLILFLIFFLLAGTGCSSKSYVFINFILASSTKIFCTGTKSFCTDILLLGCINLETLVLEESELGPDFTHQYLCELLALNPMNKLTKLVLIR
jgi:hypothetical protein